MSYVYYIIMRNAIYVLYIICWSLCLCGRMPACGQAVGCGVCDTPRSSSGVAPRALTKIYIYNPKSTITSCDLYQHY